MDLFCCWLVQTWRLSRCRWTARRIGTLGIHEILRDFHEAQEASIECHWPLRRFTGKFSYHKREVHRQELERHAGNRHRCGRVPFQAIDSVMPADFKIVGLDYEAPAGSLVSGFHVSSWPGAAREWKVSLTGSGPSSTRRLVRRAPKRPSTPFVPLHNSVGDPCRR